MFTGSVPKEVLIVLNEIMKGHESKDVYIGCSGNFTVDKTMGKMGFDVHSNDVSLYSKLIADIITGSNTELEVVNQELIPVFDNWCQSKYKDLVMVMFAMRLSEFEQRKNDYQKHFFEIYLKGADAYYSKTIEKLEKDKLNFKIKDFYFGEFVEFLKNKKGKGVGLSFPPTYKGGYEKMYDYVGRDGFLSQLTFGMLKKNGKYLILSGNHRLKASIKAGLKYILILFIDEVDRDTQLEYQLSHNALVGKDDVSILREIFEEIKSIESKKFSGLNDFQFIEANKIEITPITDGDIELTEVKFLFVEDKKNDVNNILKTLESQRLSENSSIVVGSFDSFVKTITAVKLKYGIKSNTVAFGRMIEICETHICEQE